MTDDTKNTSRNQEFKILFPDNERRVSDAYGAMEPDDTLGGMVVTVVKETVANGLLDVGYHLDDAQPMVRFTDPDSLCETRVALRSLLEEQVEGYRRQIDAEIDGDPVYFRFARFMLEGVKYFMEEEAAGRMPS